MTAHRVPRVAKGKRPQYFKDPATDKLMAIVVSLIGELSVTRDRLDALERLLEMDGSLSRQQLDGMQFDEDAASERDRERKDYIRRVMRIVTMELQQTNKDGATPSFDEQMKSLLR